MENELTQKQRSFSLMVQDGINKYLKMIILSNENELVMLYKLILY